MHFPFQHLNVKLSYKYSEVNFKILIMFVNLLILQNYND